MKESPLFTKFDICWGYNNICIQEEDQWKAAFITPMGLFKPTVMFFGFCISKLGVWSPDTPDITDITEIPALPALLLSSSTTLI